MYLIGSGHVPSCSDVLSKHRLMSLGRAMWEITFKVLEQMNTCSFPSYPEVAFRFLPVDTFFFFFSQTRHLAPYSTASLGRLVSWQLYCSHSPLSEMNKIASSRMILKKKKNESFCSFTDTYGSLEEGSVFLLSLIKLSCIPGLH